MQPLYHKENKMQNILCPCCGKPKKSLAKTFSGHRYGLQALKPSVEPIIVFQKPYEGKPLQNIIDTGAGAINIDGGRIPLAQDDEYSINTFNDGAKPFGNGAGHGYTSRKVENTSRKLSTQQSWKQTSPAGSGSVDDSWQKGRWPANFILDESVAGRLDEQCGYLGGGGKPKLQKREPSNINFVQSRPEYSPYEDTLSGGGGASRFFFNVQEQIDEADPIYYCGKVSPKERNAGLDGMEDKVAHAAYGDFKGTPVHSSNMNGKQKNPHPTLKPIALAKYLATLLLPPDEYAPRRILIPFSGVGSEMVGAALAGWEHIVGIEFDTENDYVEIAKKRIEYWTNK
jgi:hypothetical protein